MSPLVRSRVAVTVAYAVQGLSLAILVTRIPAIKDRFGLSDGDLALYLVLVPVMAGVGSAIAGILTARVHSAPVLRVVGPLVPIAVVAVGFAPTTWALALAIALLGVGVGATDATMNMQAVALQQAYGRPVISSCYAWYSLISIVGALVAAGAASLELPLGVFFLICAIIAVPIQLIVGPWLLPDAVLGHHEAEPRRVPWAPIVVIGIALLCAYVLDSATQNWSAVFLSDALGSTEAVAALGYAVYSLVLMLARVAVDRFVPRYGPVLLVASGAVLAIIAVGVIALAPTSPIALFGFGLLGLAVAPMIPLAFVAAASHDPDGTGRAVARVNIFNYIGILLGAPLIGLIAEVSSLRVGFGVMAIAAVVVLLLARSYRPAPIPD